MWLVGRVNRSTAAALDARLCRNSRLVVLAQSTALVTGTLTGAVAGSQVQLRTHSRWSLSKPLKCESENPREQDQQSLLERLQSSLSDLPLPDLPSPPALAFPSVSLPDLSGTVAKWKDSLASVSSAFSSLQTELSLGPDSTYARILADAHNPDVHPEVQWDAEVRLGRDLPHTERAFLRNRRERIRVAFAELVRVPLEEVDERDLPVVAVAASGGGYRAMINTTASLVAAKESGLFDVVTYMSAVSGSCWALNTLYSVGGGDLDWTLRHLRERVKEPFLAPETFVKLFAIDDDASRLLLSAAILKRASQGGELSLPDVYGTLVSSRLYLSDDDATSTGRKDEGLAAPRPLSLATLKTSTQRQYMDDGSHPLPIYTTVRHDLPSPEELAEAEKKAQEGGGPAAGSEGEGGGGTEPVAAKLSWTWFETTPYEVGSDKLGAFIPTWSLGRVFENGKSTERVPELGVPVLSGVYASAFTASLLSYFLEIKPLLVALPYFSAIDEFGASQSKLPFLFRIAKELLTAVLFLSYLLPATVKSNAHKLDAIHPFPPAELPNFLYGLEPSLPTPSSPSDGSPSSSSATPTPSTIPHALTEARTLGFADAGVELNLPYVPLLRRSVDVIIALDSSADSHDVWFTRAAEYAKTYESEAGGGLAATVGNGGGAARGSRWPAVDVKALFPNADTGAGGAGTVQIKENEKDRNRAAARVDQAKQQENEAGLSGSGGAAAQDEERGGVRLKNPKPTPLGSAPESKEMAAREEDLDQSHKKAAAQGNDTSPPSSSGDGDTTKPMPESQTKEPPLGKCSIWIGSTKAEDAATCRNDHPTVEDVVRRDGIALAYIPLSPDDEFKNPLEVFSTWKFDYTEDETDRLIRLAKGARASRRFSILPCPVQSGEADHSSCTTDNFNAGEQQLKTLLKGVWLRKKQQRLREEQQQAA